MIELEYLSVSEFALNAGVSKQAIYKQISNENSQIYPYLLKDGKRTFIKISALRELYGVDIEKTNFSPTQKGKNAAISTQHDSGEVESKPQYDNCANPTEQPNQPNTTQDNQPISTDYIEFLKAQITELKAEKTDIEKRLNTTIQEKDSIIQGQAAQLAELAQRVAQIADKALVATSQQQYLTALEKAGEREEPEFAPVDVEKPKNSVFRRIFGK